MVRKCSKCGNRLNVSDESLQKCQHPVCLSCQKAQLLLCGFEWEKKVTYLTSSDFTSQKIQAYKCPVCFQNRCCEACRKTYLTQDTSSNLCDACVTQSPTKEALTRLKIGHGIHRSAKKHLFPQCKSCEQVYDFSSRIPVKLSCSCTICAECHEKNDSVCALCKNQLDRDDEPANNSFVIEEISRIMEDIKKEEDDNMLMCTECAKEDVETDMNVCKECVKEKFGYDLDAKQNFRNIDALPICSTCAMKKHMSKNHTIIDFGPLRSRIAMIEVRKMAASKSNELETKIEEFDAIWDKMSTTVAKTKIELDKMVGIMENCKTSNDRNKMLKLNEKHSRIAYNFLNSVMGECKNLLETQNTKFNELRAINLQFSVKNSKPQQEQLQPQLQLQRQPQQQQQQQFSDNQKMMIISPEKTNMNNGRDEVKEEAHEPKTPKNEGRIMAGDGIMQNGGRKHVSRVSHDLPLRHSPYAAARLPPPLPSIVQVRSGSSVTTRPVSYVRQFPTRPPVMQHASLVHGRPIQKQ